MKMTLRVLTCANIILMLVMACERRIPHDNSQKLNEIDKELKVAKENSKKSEVDLKKTQQELKDIEKKLSQAFGDEKIKLEKSSQDLKEALTKHDKTVKQTSIQIIDNFLDIINQIDTHKRNTAYERLPTHAYDGDILKIYFSGGNRPNRKDLEALEQKELNKVQKDLAKVIASLH